MRLVVTNTTSTIYYIKVDVNAGYNYNTLALLNIISEYDEDDVTIAAYIDGTLSTTFPTTRNYSVSVSCTVKGSASNATGTAIWDTTNSKWLLNITGADTGETRCNAYFTFQNDSSGANAPNLATNMIPVIYDNTNDVWTKADVNNKTTTWYDYNNQIWANAVTVTSSTRSAYNSAAAGTQILMSDILGFWVWIPRYEYMYNNLAASYAGGTQSMPGGISIKFISGTNTTSDPNYLIHPAFRNGNTYKCSSNYDLGGWDKELTGFWMGKFETGYATINNGDVVLTSNILVKPDVFSLGGQTTSKKYSTAQNIQTDHGIGTSIDTHMTKNDEWGAVAYLSQSNYGKYGNSAYSGANKEIYVNNAYYSSTTAYIPEKKSNNSIALLDNEIAYEIYYDHYSSGRSAGTYSGNTGSTLDSAKQYGNYEYNNCPASAYGHTSCSESTRISNNTLGTGASTTGNIYGIYDMAGGLDEAVMANYLGTIGTTGFSEMPSQKYWNKYTSNSLVSSCNGCLCYGQAITETNAGGNSGQYQWYNNFMFFVDSSYPQVNRGNSAGASDTSSVGIFSFYAYTVNSSSGFRVSAS